MLFFEHFGYQLPGVSERAQKNFNEHLHQRRWILELAKHESHIYSQAAVDPNNRNFLETCRSGSRPNYSPAAFKKFIAACETEFPNMRYFISFAWGFGRQTKSRWLDELGT